MREAISVPGQAGNLRVALREIVAEYGPAALSNAPLMSNLLRDVLPDSPAIARLLVAAAEDRLSEKLRDHVSGGLDPVTAVRLTSSSFGVTTRFTPGDCAWVAGELAIALGFLGAGEVPGPAAADTVPAVRGAGQAASRADLPPTPISGTRAPVITPGRSRTARAWLPFATAGILAGVVLVTVSLRIGSGAAPGPMHPSARPGTARSRPKRRAGPPHSLRTVVISHDTTLSADIVCSDLTIDPGVTLTTDGHDIYCTGTVDNQGIIVTGRAAQHDFPRSYGGSGGGSTDLGGPARPGLATRAPGGAPCSASGCTAANGSSPPFPVLTRHLVTSWYRAGMNRFLAGAGGGSSQAAHGGAGGNGLFIEAKRIIAGQIVSAGYDGENLPGLSTAGGGGGGVIVLAYSASLTPGRYSVGGGYTVTADGTHHEFGGRGRVVTRKFPRLPAAA